MFSGHRPARLLPLAIFALAWPACSNTSDVEVSSQYGPGVKLDGLGDTYSWVRHAHDDAATQAELDQLIRTVVDRHLAQRGFVRRDDGSADIHLAHHISVKDHGDFSVNPHGEVYKKGSLILDVGDPASGKIIWRGAASARLDRTLPPDEREKRLDFAVARLMEKFPPRTGQPPRP